MEYSRHKLLILACLAEGMVVITAIGLAIWFDIRINLSTGNLARDIFIGTLGSLLPLALFLSSLSKKAERIPLIGSLRKTVITDIKEVFSNARILDIVMISLIAGFAEEILFRGVIQEKFGIIFASIIFGLIHLVTPAYVVMATIMGFYLGLFFLLYESLIIPIQLHFIYDLGALLYLRYFMKPEVSE